MWYIALFQNGGSFHKRFKRFMTMTVERNVEKNTINIKFLSEFYLLNRFKISVL